MLYYHNDEAADLQFQFVISSSAARVGLFEHDHSTADPSLKINHLDDGVEDTVLYVQGLSGVYSKIEIPYLEAWIDSMPLALNHIELEIPLDYNDPTGTVFPKANYYNLYAKNNEGTFQRILDNFFGQDYFGGYIVDSVVRFRITSHLQDFLEQKIDDAEVNIFVRTPSITPSRTIFTSPLNTNRARLRFTYTRIKN